MNHFPCTGLECVWPIQSEVQLKGMKLEIYILKKIPCLLVENWSMVQSDCNGQWWHWWLVVDSCLLSTSSLPPSISLNHPPSPLPLAFASPKTPTLCIIDWTFNFPLFCENPEQSPSHSHYFLLARTERSKTFTLQASALSCSCPWHISNPCHMKKLDPQLKLQKTNYLRLQIFDFPVPPRALLLTMLMIARKRTLSGLWPNNQ